MAKKSSAPSKEVRIERYKQSRFWGVWLGEKLLVVTVYKCGAESVARLAKGILIYSEQNNTSEVTEQH